MKTVKKSISILLSILIIISSFSISNLSVYASTITGQCGPHSTYRYEEATGKLVFEGSGFLQYCSPNLRSADVKSIEFGPQITEIGDDFFKRHCSVSKTLTIPDNIQYIGKNAFEESCLEKVILPRQMKVIDTGAFKNCSNLKTVIMPQKITGYLNSKIFSDCVKLEKVDFPECEDVPFSMFSGCTSLKQVSLPKELSKIGESAFENCISLSSISIPEKVSQIGDSAFKGCVSLSSIFLPKELSEVGGSAFENCISLSSISLPKNVSQIGQSAFRSCVLLKNITIPDTVVSIEANAFSGCRSLQDVVIPASVDYIGANAFDDTFFLKENFNNFSSMTGYFGQSYFDYEVDGMCIKNDKIINARNAYLKKEIVIPNGITRIEDDSFSNCSNITKVVCPESLIHIGNMAFFDCPRLNSVSLNDGLNSIGQQAFESCISLKRITIPKSVQFIADTSFKDCEFEEGGFVDHSALANSDLSYGRIEYSVVNDMLIIQNNQLRGIKREYVNFDGHLIVPEGLVGVDLSFLSQTKISGITLPKSVKKITGTTSYCESLKTVIINSDIDTIPSNVFQSSSSIVTVKIQGATRKIAAHAFEKCSSLNNLELSCPLQEIGQNAFAYCSSIKTLNLPKTLKTIENNAFYSCAGLENIEIPNDVTELSDSTFYFCKALNTVKLPNTLHKIGAQAFKNCGSLTNIDLSNIETIGRSAFDSCTKITTVVFSKNIKKIGDSAFSFCTSLNSIDLPEALTFIGQGAFNDTAYFNQKSNWYNNCLYIGNYLITYKNDVYDKNKLKSDTYGIADKAFQRCKEMASISFPDGVRVLGNELFSFPDHKETLMKFYIPKSVKRIGESPFELLRCRGSEIYYDGSLEEWVAIEKNGSIFKPSSHTYSCKHPEIEGYVGFKVKDNGSNSYSEVTIDDIRQLNTDKISAYSFANCSQLSGDLIISESVKQIGESAFESCSNIETVAVRGEVTSITKKTFYNCNSIRQVVLPNTIQQIDDSAFQNCSALKSIDLGNQIKKIGQSAFESCPELVTVTNNNTVERVEDGAFRNCNNLHNLNTWDKLVYIGGEAFKNCQQLESLTFSHNLTTIRSRAFLQCQNLKSFIILNSLKNIGEQVFKECPNLETVVIEEGVTQLPKALFYQCIGLKNVTIPSTLKNISDSLFYSCTSLENIEIPEGVKTIEHNAFAECTELKTIKLPHSISIFEFGAFFQCKSLKDVIYNGNINEWVVINFKGKATVTNQVILGSDDSYLHYYFEFLNDGSNPCLYSRKLVTTDKTLSKVELNVTKINNWALTGLDDIQEIIISDSVKEIEPAAFRDMSGLQKIKVNSNNTAYSSEDGVLFNKDKTQLLNYPAQKAELTYEIAPIVKTISGLAFYGNENLKNVIVKDTVERIGWGCFGNCSSLESIQLPFVGGIREYISLSDISHFSYIFGNKYISNEKMHESHTNLRRGILSIGENEPGFNDDLVQMYFVLPPSLKSVVIKNNFNEYNIHNSAFANCDSIENIKLDCNVYTIGSNAFLECNSVKTLHPLGEDNNGIGIKNTLQHIGYAAFSDCANLTNIILPEHVLTIGNQSFANLNSLTTCKLSEDLEYIYSLDDETIIEKAALGSSGLDEVFRNSGAFSECENLEELVIPQKNLKEIQGASFIGCNKLSSVTLPKTLRKVGAIAFYNCKGLKDIIINGPTYVSFGAFAESQKLNSLILNNERITEFSQYDGNYDKTYYLGFFKLDENLNLSSELIQASTYKFPITLKKWDKICEFENGVVTAGNTDVQEKTMFVSDKVKSLVFEEGVTSIGDDSFYSCPNLEELVLPNSLKTIGANFLRDGQKLRNIIIPENVEIIKNGFCATRDIDTIQLPAGLKEFSYNNRNMDVDLFICRLPKDIRKRCSKQLLRLTSQSFYTDLTNIKPYTFPSKDKITGQGSVFIGNNTKKIEYDAMDNINLSTLISFNKNVDMTTAFNVETMNYNDFALKTKHLYAYKDSKLKELYEKYAVNGEKVTYLYDVIYHTDGGEFIDSDFYPEKVYVDKEEIDLSPNVSKAGKIFVGWSTRPNGDLVESIKATQNTDLYAVYKNAKYSISFDANGGEGTTPGMGSDTKENIKLLKNGFYKKGCTFLGWSKDKDAKKPDYLDGAVCSPFNLLQRKVTLYAIWKENKAPEVEEKPVAPEIITVTKTYDDQHPDNEPQGSENEGDDATDIDLDIEKVKGAPETGDNLSSLEMIITLLSIILFSTTNIVLISSYKRKKGKDN